MVAQFPFDTTRNYIFTPNEPKAGITYTLSATATADSNQSAVNPSAIADPTIGTPDPITGVVAGTIVPHGVAGTYALTLHGTNPDGRTFAATLTLDFVVPDATDGTFSVS